MAVQSTEPTPVTEVPREVTVVSDEDSVQEVELGPGTAGILRTTRNYNAGWVAELNGKELPVQRVDGWAQGWRVPAGDGGDLVIRYAPEKSYVILLFSGLAVALVILLLALVVMARTKLGPETQPELVQGRRRRGTLAALLVLGGAPAWVFGGPQAAVGLVLSAVFVLLGWRRPVLWLAGLLLVACSRGGGRVTAA